MNYIVMYIKVPYENNYTVICSDGSKYSFRIDNGGLYYLSFKDYTNKVLFDKFNIDREKLYLKVFNRNYNEYGGLWPYCFSGKECITLLKALIKETQIKYYAYTEI